MLDEDRDKLQQNVEQLIDSLPDDSDDGMAHNPDDPPRGPDYFERALEKLRQEKQYNVGK